MTPIGALPSTNLDMLGTRLRVRLLRHMAVRGGEHTGRGLARVLGEQHKQVLTALRALWQAGLLVRKSAPPALLYGLNREHYLVREALLPAFLAEARWTESLGEEIRAVGRGAVESVLLYGSVARSSTVVDAGSDVDIAVVVGKSGDVQIVRRALQAVQASFHERYGHAVSPVVFSQHDFRSRLRKRDPLVCSIVRDGEAIAGRPLVDILGKVTTCD